MSKILLNLPKEYTNAYDLNYKKKYSEPKIYNANGDLSKRWYVYYSFRNPTSDKLERQTPIYAGVNHFKKLKERNQAIKILCKTIDNILKNGYNPYQDNTPVALEEEIKKYTIAQAVDFAIEIKQQTLRDSSFESFRSRVRSFKTWLLKNGFENRTIDTVNRKTVMTFLNQTLARTSAVNTNSTKGNLSSFFQVLVDNEIIAENFMSKIPILKSTPKRNKTYTSTQEQDILDYLIQNNKTLLLFIQFISYNHLRPIEVVRLKVKDINTKDKLIYLRAKNKEVKTKIIPEILLKELPSLENANPDHDLFTPYGIGTKWDAKEICKRSRFTDDFKKVKDHLNMGEEYGLYSFRHTFITKLYRELVKDKTPFEAKSKLMLITGHTSMSSLEKYLRDIDAELPEDYSDLFK